MITSAGTGDQLFVQGFRAWRGGCGLDFLRVLWKGGEGLWLPCVTQGYDGHDSEEFISEPAVL